MKNSTDYIPSFLRVGAAFTVVTACLLSGAQAAAAERSGAEKSIEALMTCEQLALEDFTRIREAPAAILSTELVAAGGETSEHCSIKGYIQPQIQFELRLPTGTWNGRYLQAGCGFFCGQVNLQRSRDALARNFAVAAENMGHVADSLFHQLWGSDPQLRRDFGRRSTHVMAVAGQAIVERFYGLRADYSYFRGCSTGGRQGLQSALHYPNDFDGIIAGDPAFPALQGGLMNNWIAHQLNTEDDQPVFDREKLAFLNAAVLEKCDAIDGLRDGIIEDPRNCDFDVSQVKVCPAGQDAPDCLTARQMEAAANLYGGIKTEDGRTLYPGFVMVGSELGWDPMRNRELADNYLKYLAFEENPPADYRYRDFRFDTDLPKLEKMAAVYDPVPPFTDPDLSAFHASGGKLITYHGWADAGVSPLILLDFSAEAANPFGGLENMADWYRVFMVPGMFHCGGGGVPDTFDWITTIVDWVEKDRAPDRVIASQYKDSNRFTGEHGELLRTRSVYPYPLVSRYTGEGDVNEADNWQAVEPPVRHDNDIKWVWDPD
jgi:feruloyl esterase